jgi:Dyp-type peroxidase family
MSEPVTELFDIQGIVRSGYGTLTEATFLLLRIVDARKARAWLSAIAARSGSDPSSYRVTTAADLSTKRDTALQIAFTATGLRNMGVAEDLVSGFSHEFCGGMAGRVAAVEGRSRRLGDLGANAPQAWIWGGRDDVPDALLMLYGTAGTLPSLIKRVWGDLAGGFDVTRELSTRSYPTTKGERREPFGFVDGISQPTIDWKAEGNHDGNDQTQYSNLMAAGEFLLGYANEYGIYEDRPLIEPERDPHGILPPAPDDPSKRDLARNGSYLVFRQLDQDVQGFWRFASSQHPDDGGVKLAEAMVGRKLETGEPLVQAKTPGIPGVSNGAADGGLNAFTFDTDPDGLACPFGAHVRRANPRTADIPGGKQDFLSWGLRTLGFKRDGLRDDLVSSARFHRLIRRGRAYGDAVDGRGSSANGGSRSQAGLHFICLNANISRQFEFVQSAWLVSSSFNGVSGETDPLLGNRLPLHHGRPTDAFTLPQAAGPCRRVLRVPQFITVRGGAYFILPSLRALRFFAQ